MCDTLCENMCTPHLVNNENHGSDRQPAAFRAALFLEKYMYLLIFCGEEI